MELISSRKNAYIRHVRLLASDREYRQSCREFLCDGMKTLEEALRFGAEVVSILWKDKEGGPLNTGARQYLADAELFDYASPMKNSPGPLFSVRMPERGTESVSRAVVLENVQDPGNVGTVIRTANAFGIDTVVLASACADLYNPKTVRATMGAIFRQRVLSLDLSGLKAFLEENALPLYGAALSEKAKDVRRVPLKKAAVAIGSEGRGLSREMLELCDGQVIIPMDPDSESLNAAVAASILMWEMAR